MTTVTYPFDPTGSNPLNRIVNEQHVLTSLNDTQLYQTVIPSAAPFFTDNLVLTFRNPDASVRILTEGIDYYFTHLFISASRATAKPVAGSITFLDKDITGVLRLTYQTIGGVWVLPDNEIATIIANMVKNPRTTAWEQITDLPFQFPVIDHEWNLVDMVGASEIVEAIDGVRDAVLAGNAGGIAAHVNNKENPHEVSKAQVGLGSVQNYPVASQSQAQAGTNNTTYMTPLRVADAITALGPAIIAPHLANVSNPHNTTKAQVGLALVENYPMASNAEAIAGIAADRYMSPASTKAIVDIVNAALAAHETDQTNPHNVAKDQVSLWNVENYPIATAVEAQLGDANDRYMTPLRTKQAILTLAAGDLSAHTMDFDNPHNVTKAQVGLVNVENYVIASQLDAEAGSANDRYMTPLRVSQAITAQVGQNLLDHLNAENPHNVTAAQVGAYTIAEVGALLGQKMTNGDTAVDSMALEGSNKAQLIAETVTTALEQVGTAFAPQTKIPATPRNPGLGTMVWVNLGKVTLDENYLTPTGQFSNLQWILSGGGYSSHDENRHGAQMRTVMLSGNILPKYAVGNPTPTVVYDLKAKWLSYGIDSDTNAPLELGYVFNGAAGEVTIFARVPNGHNDIVITDLSPNFMATPSPRELVDPVTIEVGDIAPVGLQPLPITWLHDEDGTLVHESEMTTAIGALATSTDAQIDAANAAITELQNDLTAFVEEVRVSFEELQTAINGA